MAELRMTFLGTGTSVGVPMIGCDCPVCRSEDPRNRRTRSSLFIETAEAQWVVDTGPEFRMQCLRENITRLDAVVYTHAHTDHVVGFDDLRRFCDAEGFFLPVYGSPETLEQIQLMFGFAFFAENHFPGYVKPDPRPIEKAFHIGSTMITPLPIPHGRFVVYGYLFTRGERKLAAYLSDCHAVPAEVRMQIENVEALVVDGLRHRPHPTHMSVEQAIEVAQSVGAHRTWLTHISHELDHAETEAALPSGVRLAYDGLTIEL